jgi:hypothetical protein
MAMSFRVQQYEGVSFVPMSRLLPDNCRKVARQRMPRTTSGACPWSTRRARACTQAYMASESPAHKTRAASHRYSKTWITSMLIVTDTWRRAAVAWGRASLRRNRYPVLFRNDSCI